MSRVDRHLHNMLQYPDIIKAPSITFYGGLGFGMRNVHYKENKVGLVIGLIVPSTQLILPTGE